MVRDENFDAVPSFSIKRGDEDLDLTYYQLKELKASLPKTAIYANEFANCYGVDTSAFRKRLLHEHFVEVLGLLLKTAARTSALGVLQLKMLSETLLLIGYESQT